MILDCISRRRRMQREVGRALRARRRIGPDQSAGLPGRIAAIGRRAHPSKAPDRVVVLCPRPSLRLGLAVPPGMPARLDDRAPFDARAGNRAEPRLDARPSSSAARMARSPGTPSSRPEARSCTWPCRRLRLAKRISLIVKRGVDITGGSRAARVCPRGSAANRTPRRRSMAGVGRSSDDGPAGSG